MSLAELKVGDIRIGKYEGRDVFWKIITIDKPLTDKDGNTYSTRRKAQIVTGRMKKLQGQWVFTNGGMLRPHTFEDTSHLIFYNEAKS